MKRQEQRVEDTWRMEDIYATQEDYNADVKKIEALMQQFHQFCGTLDKGAANLLLTLEQYNDMGQIMERLNVYAGQRNHEDTSHSVYQKLIGEAQTLAARLSQCVSWLEPEIISLPQETIDRYYEEEEGLKKYRRQIEQITRMREHILDNKTEELLARASEMGRGPYNIYSMFNNADIRFPDITDSQGQKHKLTSGAFISYMQSPDRTLRESAFKSLYSVYEQYKNTVSAVYFANAKQEDFFAKIRNYANTMEAHLDENAIPVSVYENLVKAINDRLPAMHRYVRLRKKMLGVSELHMYDAYAPLVKNMTKTYTFEEAKGIVKRGLAPLGEDYQALLQEAFDNRWIDVYENEGKRTGAYSWGPYGVHPYILLNYHGILDNVFTLAHELGHSIHSWYSDHAQPFCYAGYRIFVAEVASTCNEAILIHDLLERSTNTEEKKYLINHFLEKFKGTMFRQTMFAEFEMNTHAAVNRGETLTAQGLCDYYLELNKKYFGEDMIADREISFEWERIPHFYTAFYVYQYATGFAAAIAISSKILKGEPGIVEKYKKFLSGGCSMDPIDLLKICGIDMSDPKPIHEALDVFEEYIEEMERLA